MSEVQAYREQIKSMSDFLGTVVDEVPEEQLHERPGPHMNPVGWNYWHILRVWDVDLNWLVKGQTPAGDAWHRGGFSEESGYNPDGKGRNGSGIGVGYTDAEVDDLSVIPGGALRGYHQMLLAETEEYLDAADDLEIRREMADPLNPDTPSTVAARFQHAVSHSWNHIGELRYAKGILGMHDRTYPGS